MDKKTIQHISLECSQNVSIGNLNPDYNKGISVLKLPTVKTLPINGPIPENVAGPGGIIYIDSSPPGDLIFQDIDGISHNVPESTVTTPIASGYSEILNYVTSAAAVDRLIVSVSAGTNLILMDIFKGTNVTGGPPTEIKMLYEAPSNHDIIFTTNGGNILAQKNSVTAGINNIITLSGADIISTYWPENKELIKLNINISSGTGTVRIFVVYYIYP